MENKIKLILPLINEALSTRRQVFFLKMKLESLGVIFNDDITYSSDVISEALFMLSGLSDNKKDEFINTSSCILYKEHEFDDFTEKELLDFINYIKNEI